MHFRATRFSWVSLCLPALSDDRQAVRPPDLSVDRQAGRQTGQAGHPQILPACRQTGNPHILKSSLPVGRQEILKSSNPPLVMFILIRRCYKVMVVEISAPTLQVHISPLTSPPSLPRSCVVCCRRNASGIPAARRKCREGRRGRPSGRRGLRRCAAGRPSGGTLSG